MLYKGPIPAVDETWLLPHLKTENNGSSNIEEELKAELASVKKELKEADKRLERAYQQDQLLILTLKELAFTKEQLSRVLEE